jgi:hypothetical protein
LIYYGYEKILEIYKGEFLESYRLLSDISDMLMLWFLIKTLLCTIILIRISKVKFYVNHDKPSYYFNLTDIIQSNNIDYYNMVTIYIDEYYYFIYNYNVFTVVSFSRLLKHSILYRPLEIIVRSLLTICYNLLQFSPFVILVFIAFALFGVSVFSSLINEFQTLNKAILTLISILLGELNFDKYYEYNQYIGTVYFCSYVIVIAIICFNILSAIINESYESVRNFLNDDSQKYHITPDNEFVQRNFNFIIKMKLNRYEPDVRKILEGMVQLSSSNRLLTKIEIDSELKKFEYDDESLIAVLIKYGMDSAYTELTWKKNQMDQFRKEINKERQDLDDLFAIYMKLNEENFKKKRDLETSKQLFVRKEKYYNLEQKIYRLKNLIKILDLKSKTIISNIKLLKK